MHKPLSISDEMGGQADPDLYERDETAWLDIMADLIKQGRQDELDYGHLAEYLTDMARRDRREVRSRLRVLLKHLLNWLYQPDQRSNSWRGSVIHQRHELAQDLAGGVLRHHAEEVLAATYAEAVAEASAETGLPRETFPSQCPSTIEQLLAIDLSGAS